MIIMIIIRALGGKRIAAAANPAVAAVTWLVTSALHPRSKFKLPLRVIRKSHVWCRLISIGSGPEAGAAVPRSRHAAALVHRGGG